MQSNLWRIPADRRVFIGGSDARIIMGNDEAALIQLWREKRGEAEPEDLRRPMVRAERYRRRHARELQHAKPGNVPDRRATAASAIRTRAGKGTRSASGRTRLAVSVPPTR